MSTPINTIKLDRKFKREWVAALRSGKYKQGTGELYQKVEVDKKGKTEAEIGYSEFTPAKDETRYCCLGVAGRICEIPIEKLCNSGGFLDTKTIKHAHRYKNEIKKLEGHDGLPKRLADFNDDGTNPKSFNWIASYIERYL